MTDMDCILTEELARLVHTPAYIFDIDEFHHRVTQVKEAFGEEIGLCFSIKANPFLLPCLPDTFQRIEVCSPGELTVCERVGTDMSKVIFSGVNKTRADVERAMDDQVGIFTAESPLHLAFIDDCARKRGRTVPVLIRLTAGSQFGMDEQDVISIIKNREQFPGIDIIGLHFFSGTQKKKISGIEKELQYLESFIATLAQERDFRVRHLEYGTGLAVDYFTADAGASELERLQAVAVPLREMAKKVCLTVEMGRFFAAPCGYYFTRVMDVKTNCGINYAIVDGGLHQLKYAGQIQGMQLPRVAQLRPEKCIPHPTSTNQWTLCGSLCSTADILARDMTFEDLAIGDTLIFKHTGAYSVTEGMALFLSRELPEVSVFSRAQGLTKVREIFNTDILNTPEALSSNRRDPS